MNTIKKKATVYGVGINDADYSVRKCNIYKTWADMLRRCYSCKYQTKFPSYVGCTVSEDWMLFSNFRDWMVKQDYKGLQLDKDILIRSNKIYSESTCVFVTGQVNNFVTDCAKGRNGLRIGVSIDKKSGRFLSTCSNPFTSNNDRIGCFDSEEAAHNAWLKRKLEHAYALAAIQTDQRVADALVKRYLYYEV